MKDAVIRSFDHTGYLVLILLVIAVESKCLTKIANNAQKNLAIVILAMSSSGVWMKRHLKSGKNNLSIYLPE